MALAKFQLHHSVDTMPMHYSALISKNIPKGVELMTMFSYRFCLFCLLGTLCICLCVGSSNMTRCIETERQALLQLKDGFSGESGIHSSWKGQDCCSWKGISCNNLTGHVIRLDLNNYIYSFTLEGKLDSSICKLQHLTFLDLTYNFLEGKIPKCIGSLVELIELRLPKNNFTSSIPRTLGNLSSLQTLDLWGNDYLVANDLEWVSHLSNLRYLNVSYVNLGQALDWQSSISKIPSLIELYLDGCGLPQVNPNSVPHMNSSSSLQILSLSGNSLNSSILSWLLNVSEVLTYLDLSYNELDGRISKSFQSFCRLQTLRLSSNKLFGQLSDYIQQLSCAQNSIEKLYLGDNPFSSGPLPDLSRLSSLKTLNLQNTSIVGSLSMLDFTKLVSLEILDLSDNELNGTLPYAIGQLSALDTFDVSSNKLSGVISEAHLSNLFALRNLYVSHNLLTFNLSSNWVPPFHLYVLSASSCILGPNFPSWLKHQRDLFELYIPNSGISDSFPEWFWNLSPNLQSLNVSHNKLRGALPKSLPSLQVDSSFPGEWDLSFNKLSGPLPHFPQQIGMLLLSNNMFSGSLSSFCATPLLNLTDLDLFGNLLVGQLPDCWEQFQSLQVLNLANNNFSGKIPESFGTLHQIESIHLNNNSFSGAIPSLTSCKNLKLIDFGDNNLEGKIPAWVGYELHLLIVLRLRANKFQGSIPASLCNLLHLQVLDLSKNDIIGEIPQCLGDIFALSNITFPREVISYYVFAIVITKINPTATVNDRAILTWKGENREYGKNLGLMTMVDLSCNHLIGEIPHSITTLVALASLNLSRNSLTGFIPSNIGHMKMLESLDLSRNYLYGRIPASLSNLTFLSYMNLSFNSLSGKIPKSTQLDTFDASTYVGNNGLCGPPIKNQCLGDENSPSPQLIGSTDKNGTAKDELITFGFFVSLGFGFIVGFWGACGTLLLKSSWRHSYFKFFNNINDWVHVHFVVFVNRMKRRFQVQD